MTAEQIELEKQKTELLVQQSLLLAQLEALKQFLEAHGMCSNFECTGECNLVHLVQDEKMGDECSDDAAPFTLNAMWHKDSVCNDINCDICLG